MSAEHVEQWTILKLLEWTTNFFKQRGADSPRLDAELLLAEARGCERIELYTAFNEEPGEEVRAAFRELVRRRGEGTPVAYLLGKKEFYSLPFRVDESTLIPRPETEHLVIEVLDEVKRCGSGESPLKIADVGTGSGIIAICLAKELPKACFTAIDVSESALQIARFNASTHGVSDRVEFVCGDLLSSLPETPIFDFVCSNPPYVRSDEFEHLDRTVRDFEPRAALVAGPTGIELIIRLIAESIPRLRSGGRLIFEISPMIADSVLEHLTDVSDFQECKVIKDLAGHQRVVSVKKRET